MAKAQPSQRSLLAILAALVFVIIISTWTYQAHTKSAKPTENGKALPVASQHTPTLNMGPAKSHVPYSQTPLKQHTSPAEHIIQANWHTVIIKPGQTIASIFHDLGIDASTLSDILALPNAKDMLTNLIPKQEINLNITTDGKLLTLTMPFGTDKAFIISEQNGRFMAQISQHEFPQQVVQKVGTINHSILATIEHANIPPSIMFSLSHIFSWQINFSRDLREGDKFDVIYKQYNMGHGITRYGPIIAARFVTHHGVYTAVRFIHDHKLMGYFNAAGVNVRKPFDRFPLHFTRISSPFSLRGRYHPILHIWRPHLGVDLAAPRGTPIHSVAAGRITFRGWQRGYGNVVIVNHGHGYTTLYAHMSHFKRGEHVGSHVRQGETIGYVGATGLATGPHCHFEFRINGVHYDPTKVKLPGGKPLTGPTKVAFLLEAKKWLAQLQLPVKKAQ